MKRKMIASILVFMLSLFSANTSVLDESKVTGYKIQSDTDSYLDLEFNVKDIHFNNLSTEKGTFTSVTIEKGYTTRIEGSPALP
ncbi:MAG: hypothetical protein KAS62_10410, partial [Candidatus Delongbacteria bacterium]|nr:hypothetical protein [Candidatus Delongbacteria bacterium]